MKNILVVDNNPVILRMLTNFLEGKGYLVFRAENGLQAMEILDCQPIDLAIIDLVMPHISGDKLCKIIRSREDLAAIPLVVYSEVEDESFVLSIGADVCIAKGPFKNTERHLEKVLEHLENNTLGKLKGDMIGRAELYRRQITTELISSLRHYELIFEEMAEGVIELSPDGRIFRVNKAALSFCGCGEVALLGSDFFKLFSAADADMLRRLVNDMKNGEISVREPDDPVMVCGREMGIKFLAVQDDLSLFFVAILEDISERKRYEMQLRRSNADLEQFAYSISHDMRQPLRMVAGHLQLLESGIGEQLQGDLKENLQYALEGARRMDQMIVSLLEFSRLGRKSKERLNGREPLEVALAFLGPEIREKNAEIQISGEWPKLTAGRDELVRLFQNLVGNALKYYRLERPLVELESMVAEGLWRVRVSDKGVGLAPGQEDSLFRFFSRLQPAHEYPGTGMGLALCRRILENHKGRIWAESAGLGQGTSFFFEIPIS